MMGGKKTLNSLPEALWSLGDWHISELTNEEAGLVIRGKFELLPMQRLDEDQTKFLITFLRCRGVYNAMEKELGISYPTVRARLDALLKALNLHPAAEEAFDGKRGVRDEHKQILEKLEKGEITPEEAKKAMKEASK